jgi:asparagine synthase (glutamine-hydrolysing)
MAIPGEVQSRDGVSRALAREAMRGVLPEAVRERTGKADFTTMINEAVARDVPAIAHALSASSLGVQLGYLDAGRLGPAVAGLAAGLSGPESLDSWDLTDIVGLETWLRLFWPERQHARPEPCLLQEMSNESKEDSGVSPGEAPVSRASPQDPR